MKSHHVHRYLLTVLSIFLIVFGALPAQAAPINYSFSGATSGWDSDALGEITDVAFSIALVGDTSGIQPLGSGVFINPVLSANITLTGTDILNIFGTTSITGTFLDPLEMFADNGIVGFGVSGGSDLWDYIAQGTELDAYGLSFLTNPVLGGVVFADIFNTSIGDLTLAAAGQPEAADITFATPEPSTMLLLGTALFGIWGVRRKQS